MCKAGSFQPDPEECSSCGACGPLPKGGLVDIETLFSLSKPFEGIKEIEQVQAQDQKPQEEKTSLPSQVAQVAVSGTPAALSFLRTVLAACQRDSEEEVKELVDAGLAEVLVLEIENTRTQSSAHYISWQIAKALVQGSDSRAKGALLDSKLIARCTKVAPKNRPSVLAVLDVMAQDETLCNEVVDQGGINLVLEFIVSNMAELGTTRLEITRQEALKVLRTTLYNAGKAALMGLHDSIERTCLVVVREDEVQDARLLALEILHHIVRQTRAAQHYITSGVMELCVVLSRLEADKATGAEALSILQLIAETEAAATCLLKHEMLDICQLHLSRNPSSNVPWKLLVEMTANPSASGVLAKTDFTVTVRAAVDLWNKVVTSEDKCSVKLSKSTAEWWALITLQNLAAYDSSHTAFQRTHVCQTFVDIIVSPASTPAIIDHTLGIMSNLSRDMNCVAELLDCGAADAALSVLSSDHSSPSSCRCAALRLMQNLSASPVGREALIVRDCPSKCLSFAQHDSGKARFHALATLSNMLAPRRCSHGVVPIDDAALLLSPRQIEICVNLCRSGALHPDPQASDGQVMAMALLHRLARMKARPACSSIFKTYRIANSCGYLIRKASRPPSAWYSAKACGYSAEGYALLILYEMAHCEAHAEQMLQDRKLITRLHRLSTLPDDPRLGFAKLTSALTLSCLSHAPALSEPTIDALVELVHASLEGRCDGSSFHLDWPAEDLLVAVDSVLDEDHNSFLLLPQLAPSLVQFLSDAHCNPVCTMNVSSAALAMAMHIADQQCEHDYGYVEIPQLIRSSIQDEILRHPKRPYECALLVRISEQL